MPEENTNLQIVSLNTQNVMRVRAVEIKPKQQVVVVGGKNGEGKTSVLESIVMALGGPKAAQKEPVRRGQKTAIVVADLGELIVTRSWTESGTTLEVKSKEGQRFSSPQKMLDGLVGRVCFDPIHFLQLDDAKQLATLREIVGLDFTALDLKYANAYGKRTDVNRNLARVKAIVAGMPSLDDSAPNEELDASALTRELVEAEHSEEGLDSIEVRGRECSDLVNESKEKVADLERQLESAKLRVLQYIKQQEQLRKEYADKKEAISKLKPEEIRQKIASIKETNDVVKANKARMEKEAEIIKLQDEVAALEKTMGDISIDKEKQMTAAKFPVEGLSFDDTGLLFNKVPFTQASGAQKLRTSISMGIALNPKIRVMIIRDGSLLDEDNMELIREMAEEANVQVWIERVGRGEECSVIIEDGEVLEDRTDNPPPPKADKPKKLKGPVSR